MTPTLRTEVKQLFRDLPAEHKAAIGVRLTELALMEGTEREYLEICRLVLGEVRRQKDHGDESISI